MRYRYYFIICIAFFFNCTQADTRIERAIAKETIDFTLYAYDNIMADYFEEQDDYHRHLRYLIIQGTGLSTGAVNALIQDPALRQSPTPPEYLFQLNKRLRDKHGYYFMDY